MANWTGTYTITTPGTTATSGTTTTMTNSGATFTASCVGMTIRFLTGSNAGTTSLISAQTSTQLTFAAVAHAVVAGDTYEVVAILANNDHMTAAVTFSTNTIVEVAPSATFLSDGAFLMTFGACTVRFQMTETTLATFCGNNRTVAGKNGFWTGFTFNSSVAVAPLVQYIRLQDASTPFTLTVSSGLGNCSTVQKLWAEAVSAGTVACTGTLTQNQTIQNVLIRNSTLGRTSFQTGTWAFTETFKNFWSENDTSGGFSSSAAVNATLLVRDCVVTNWGTNNNGNLGSGTTHTMQDCYFAMAASASAGMIGTNSGAGVGTYNFKRNVTFGQQILTGTIAAAGATLVSAFNDYSAKTTSSLALNNFAASAYGTSTSDNDYIAGQLQASVENVDTTMSTTSTATPAQYKNLSATRTNAKSVFNRPYVIDNIVTGTPGTNSVAITFDCQNGVVSGQGNTTVNVTSNSGQAVLSVPSTTGFDVGEMVEVGYGTARSESLEILSISANTSLTFTTNLAFTHTSGQADTVTKTLRHRGLPYIRYGTASGVYTMGTSRPDRSDMPLIGSNLRNTVAGVVYNFAQTGHSLTLRNLQPGTTYYYVPYAVTPLGDVCVGAEQSFTTITQTIPAAADVRSGTATGVTTGTLAVAGAANVRSGTPTDNTTGTLVVPSPSNVKKGVSTDNTVGTLSTEIGTTFIG